MKPWFLHLDININIVSIEIHSPRKSVDAYQCVYLITAGTQLEGNTVPTRHCATTAVSL